MDEQQFLNLCLAKHGAYVDFPFGEDTVVFKVEKRIFAQLFRLKGIVTVTLNCSYEGGVYYRQIFEGIVTRGYHCPSVQQPYFNTMPLGAISDGTLSEMIDHGYRTVVGKLPKKVQRELEEEKVEKIAVSVSP